MIKILDLFIEFYSLLEFKEFSSLCEQIHCQFENIEKHYLDLFCLNIINNVFSFEYNNIYHKSVELLYNKLTSNKFISTNIIYYVS